VHPRLCGEDVAAASFVEAILLWILAFKMVVQLYISSCAVTLKSQTDCKRLQSLLDAKKVALTSIRLTWKASYVVVDIADNVAAREV
jgi:hypothetical protein